MTRHLLNDLYRPYAFCRWRTLGDGSLEIASNIPSCKQITILDSTVGQIAQEILWSATGEVSFIQLKTELGENVDDLTIVLNLLIEVGAIIDSREIFELAVVASDNPQIYPPDYFNNTPSGKMESEVHAYHSGTNRRSARRFTGCDISHSDLTSIFTQADSRSLSGRTLPSAGGLRPVTCFILPVHVSGLNNVWHYWDPNNGITPIDKNSIPIESIEYLFDYSHAHEPAAWIVPCITNLKTVDKYGNRGYRYAVLEAGMVTQSIIHSVDQARLDSLVFGGFSENPIINSISSYYQCSEGVRPLITIAIGKGKTGQLRNDTFPRYCKALIEGVERNPEASDWFSLSTDELNEKLSPYKLRSSCHKFTSNDGKQHTSFGIGQTSDESSLKSLMEAVERYISTTGVKALPPRYPMTDEKNDSARWSHCDIFPLAKEQIKSNGLDLEDKEKEEFSEVFSWTGKRSVLVEQKCLYYWSNGKRRDRLTTSNGVAIHDDMISAKKNAFLELIERHSLMHYLFNDSPVRSLGVSDAFSVPGKLHGVELKCYQLSSTSVPTVLCAAVRKSAPYLSIGMASSLNLDEACEKASKEAIIGIESLCLFWEQIDRESTSRCGDSGYPKWAVDHGWWFAKDKERANSLLARLDSSCEKNLDFRHSDNISISELIDFSEYYDVYYYDYPHNFSGLHCVRAVSKKLLPIVFGVEGELYLHPLCFDKSPLRYPHPLM